MIYLELMVRKKHTYFPERMSCLSCKTNRYLTNIHKSQQRVTVPQPLPIPSFPSLLPPPHSPEVSIVTRESRSNENLGGSISSCPRKAFQNLARKVHACRKFARYLEDGTWKAAWSNDASSMPVGLQETDRHTHTRARTHIQSSHNPTGRVEPLHLTLSQPCQQISGRMQLIVSKSLQLTAVSDCQRLFFC